MSWFDRLKALLGREASEAKDLLRDAEARLDADLTKREADLHATPEEKLARLTEEIEEAPDPFDEVRARIERMKAPASDAEAGAATAVPDAGEGLGRDPGTDPPAP